MNVGRALAPAQYSGLDYAAGARFITGKLLKPMELPRSNLTQLRTFRGARSPPNFCHSFMPKAADRPTQPMDFERQAQIAQSHARRTGNISHAQIVSDDVLTEYLV